LSKLLEELSCITITVIQINVPTVDCDSIAQSEVISCQEFSVLSDTFFSSEESLANRESIVLLFLFVHLYGVVFEVKQYLDFSVSFVLEIAFHDTFLKVAVESQDMSIQMYPIRLIQLRSVSGGVFRIEVFMSGG
jgi:hypothetical protein